MVKVLSSWGYSPMVEFFDFDFFPLSFHEVRSVALRMVNSFPWLSPLKATGPQSIQSALRSTNLNLKSEMPLTISNHRG